MIKKCNNLYGYGHFKCINDAFVHDEGDAVLKEFARVVKEFFPKEAVFAPQGGDEFTIFISNVLQEVKVLQLTDEISETLVKSIRGHQELSANIGVFFTRKMACLKIN